MEADEGLFVYRHGADTLSARWWAGLNEDERLQARTEAERYEGLCEEERDRIRESNGNQVGEG